MLKPEALPTELEIKLTVENFGTPIAKTLAIQYRPTYDERDIVITQSKWTDEGLDVDAPLEIDSVLNVPRSREYRKDISFAVKSRQEATIDAIQVLALQSSSPDNVTISLPGSPPFFVESPLTTEVIFSIPGEGATDIEGEWNIIADIKDYTSQEGNRKISFPFKLKTTQPEEYGYSIGIDFGTSNSCIALSMPTQGDDGMWNPPGTISMRHFKTLPLDSRWPGFDAREVPSCYDPHPAQWYQQIGRYAESSQGSVKWVKRFLTRDRVAGTSEPPIEIATKIIKELLRRARSYMDESGIPYSIFRKAVLTVPTTFWPQEVKKLEEACLNAFSDLDIHDAKPVFNTCWNPIRSA